MSQLFHFPLSHAGGDIPRALDLCFRAGEDPSYVNNTLVYDMLNTIAQVLRDAN